MLKLSEKNQYDRRVLKCGYITYSPSEIGPTNTANSQEYITMPREDSVISLLNSFLDLNFDVLHAATGNRYVDNIDIMLVNIDPIASLSNYKLTASSGRQLEYINHAHIVSSMYRLITWSRGSDDLSIGFDRSCDRRQRELTKKNSESKFNLRNNLGDIFGFAEHQETRTYGLGYKLTLTKNTDNAVLNKNNSINNGKFKINAIEWYVPHYRPTPEQ